jgi:hypothetical protein
MERLEFTISGVEEALRPTAAQAVPAQGGGGGGRSTTTPPTPAGPAWLHLVRQQLPRVMEALRAERPDSDDGTFAARADRLTLERNRLLRQLRQIAPALTDGCVSRDRDHEPEELRRVLLRLMHDIQHHHQRVNDLVYDAGWRDVGGSE